MDNMHAYPGRTFGQLYHRFFRSNDLAGGRLALGGRTLDLADVRVPVLSIAGHGDGIAPVAACHHVGELLAGAPSVQLETAPGGHLGVLTGRAARGTTWVALDRFLAEHEAAPAGRAPPPARQGRLRRGRPGYPGRMRRALILLSFSLSMSALLAPAATAQVPPPEERIRAGVTVSGVDVGNLTVAEATVKLGTTLGPVLAQDVVVTAAGRSFPLKMRALKFKFRADKTALRALYAGQAVPPAPDGSLPPASATPSVAYRRKPVWRFARATAAKVGVEARDARIRIKTYRISKVPGRKGRALAVKPLVEAIQATVADPAAPRALAPRDGRDDAEDPDQGAGARRTRP